MFWRYVLSKSNIFRNDDNEVENIVANPYPLLFKLPYFKPILLALKFLNFEKPLIILIIIKKILINKIFKKRFLKPKTLG